MNAINGDPDIVVKKVIADMVERHSIKGLKGHNGHNSCEMCEAPGNGPNGKIDFDYPRSARFRTRTHQRWRTVAR